MEHLMSFRKAVLDRINGARAVLHSRKLADELVGAARSWAASSRFRKASAHLAQLKFLQADLLPKLFKPEMAELRDVLVRYGSELAEGLDEEIGRRKSLSKKIRGTADELGRYDKQVPAWIESESRREFTMHSIFGELKLTKAQRKELEVRARNCMIEIHDMLQASELDGEGIPDAAERAKKGVELADKIDEDTSELEQCFLSWMGVVRPKSVKGNHDSLFD